jgi:prephenate dehydrogenase
MVTQASIIGAGGMGAWFARLLKSQGYRIIVTDRDHKKARRLASQLQAKYVSTNVEATLESDMIILATPANTTAKVISEILPTMRQGALICEVSAAKSVVIPALRAAQKRGIVTASIHPMFGPLARGIRGRRIIVTRTGKDAGGYEMIKQLLKEADLTLTRPEIHDKRTAVTLGLSHFINMAFAMTASQRGNLAELRRFAGRTYDLQMLLAEAVVHEPETSADIHMMNREFRPVLRELERNIRILARIVNSKDRDKLVAQYRRINKLLSADPEFKAAPIAFERVTEAQYASTRRRRQGRSRRSS